MPTDVSALISTFGSAVIGFLAARFTSGVQLRIARDNSEKDILLLEQRLLDERQRLEAALEREKLELLHKLLSKASFETGQTMSFLQNKEKDVAKFRGRHFENCARIHEALAISDLYYPDMSDSIRQIYGQADCFWGSQENLMDTDIQENKEGWYSHLEKVLEAGGTIKRLVSDLHGQIRNRGRAINPGFGSRS